HNDRAPHGFISACTVVLLDRSWISVKSGQFILIAIGCPVVHPDLAARGENSFFDLARLNIVKYPLAVHARPDKTFKSYLTLDNVKVGKLRDTRKIVKYGFFLVI